MPEAFCHEMQAGGSLYCVGGTVSDDNTVRLEITVVDSQGSIASVGELSMPLAKVRRIKEVVMGALKRVEKIPATKAYSLEDLRQEHPQSHARWTPELDAQLLGRWNAHDTVEGIGRHMGRRPSAVQSRLHKLGRVDDWHYPPAPI